MNQSKVNLEKRLLINQEYVSLMNGLVPAEYHEKLMADLKSAGGGMIVLRPPHDPELFSIYKDIRAWVYGQSKAFHYTVKVHNKSDRNTLFDILGQNHVDGTYKKGYTFRYA